VNDIVAVDNAPDLVEHFRREGINIRQGDAYKIPAPEEYFEGVFCCWLLEHLHEPDRAMREMRRVLKPGGYACVIVPTPHDMEAFYADYTHVRPFTKISLKQLAEDAGFIRHKAEYLPWMRGLSRVLAYSGPRLAQAYLRFADHSLRRVGLVNRNNLMLEAWK
jgi:ubiquinone/menaquinone biosynthesis C-methylase UbiE